MSGSVDPIEPGTEAAKIVEEEERLLARVEARVAMGEDPSEIHAVADDYDRELLALRDAIAEAKPEDLPPLVEQMTRLAAIRGRLGGSKSLPVDVSSPYFAHMALVIGDGGKKKRRDILIGKRGFIDRGSGVQIVDWRNAPISQVYYRYEEGDDYEEEMDGRTLSGLVEVRRNVSISKSVLRRIGAPQGTFVRDRAGGWRVATGSAVPTLQGGQGKAARAPVVVRQQRKKGRSGHQLGVHHEGAHRADKHLPEIAALIDKEQFDLITRPQSGLVVVQGGAGSGKTTVALHRIAYLVFADRQRFKPSRILFVVPSDALVRYVAAVLPALGVAGVTVTTYRSWAKNLRKRLLPDSPNKSTGGAPDAVVRLKKHPRLGKLLVEVVAERTAAVEAELDEALAAVPGGQAVLERWQELRGRALVPRLRALYKAISKELPLAGPTRIRAESTVKALGKEASDAQAILFETLTDEGRLRHALVDEGLATSGEVSALVKWCAAQQAEPPEVATDSEGRAIEAIDGRDLDEDDPAGRLDEEDDPLLLRLIQLLRGSLSSRQVSAVSYAHVAIDEAQDRSPIEVQVLVEATEARSTDPSERSVTIAGDTAQRVVFDNHFDGWRGLLDAIGQPDTVPHPLRLSYRSTAEVMELARRILGPELAPEDPLFARSGAPVEVHELGGVGEAVAFLGDALRGLAGREPTASVAVIARHPEQADAYYDGLRRAEVPHLRRVRRHDFRFEAGVDVTDIHQVKGLEFDYVILVDVNASSYPDQAWARHLLHIGATRAAHQLWLISTDEPSPLLVPVEDDSPG